MHISSFTIQNFRNIKFSKINCHKNFNIFYGPNGCGKTSILEAITYLALCRSFRTSNIQSLINQDSKSFVLNAKVDELINDLNISTSLGIEKKRSQDFIVSINGHITSKLSDLINKLCLQLIHPQSSELILEGPDYRRKFVDWGLYYHVDSFGYLFSRYKKILKQRNTLLRLNKLKDIYIWDKLLADISDEINTLRQEYINKFIAVVTPILYEFFGDFSFDFVLNFGYPNDINLVDLLKQNLEKDSVLGYTYYGCHRADLKVKVNKLSASSILSRGQLKLLVCAMRLAQGILLHNETKRNCIYLIDDVNSELDITSQSKLLTHLNKLNSQVFITNISRDITLPDNLDIGFFSIKDGYILED